MSELDDYATEWLNLKAEAEKLHDRLVDVEALILERLTVGERYAITGFPDRGVRVQAPSRRLNPDAAREVLGPDRYELACESAPTAAGVRRVAAGWEQDRILVVPVGARATVRAL